MIKEEAPEAIMDGVECLLKRRNNLEEAWRQYKEYGEWWEWVFEYVPISKIEQCEIWSNYRYENNLRKLTETGKMPPVRLCYYDEIYHISDGIHRIAAAKQRGYTKVPAIASYKRTYPPPRA